MINIFRRFANKAQHEPDNTTSEKDQFENLEITANQYKEFGFSLYKKCKTIGDLANALHTKLAKIKKIKISNKGKSMKNGIKKKIDYTQQLNAKVKKLNILLSDIGTLSSPTYKLPEKLEFFKEDDLLDHREKIIKQIMADTNAGSPK